MIKIKSQEILGKIHLCENQIIDVIEKCNNKRAVVKKEIENDFNTKINEIKYKMSAIRRNLKDLNNITPEWKINKKKFKIQLKNFKKEIRTLSKKKSTILKEKLKAIKKERQIKVKILRNEIKGLKMQLVAFKRDELTSR